MSDALARWNQRYAVRQGLHGFVPAPLLAEAVGDLPPGAALDLACGAGRHALALAQRGWRVVAVDGSSVGIGLMMAEAERLGCAERIEPIVADLEADPPPAVFALDHYDLACDFFYLHRPLFPLLRRAVRPGGLFVATIHTVDPQAAHPMNPAFLLRHGELPALVDAWGWEVLHAHEGRGAEDGHERAAAAIVARRTAP